MASSERALEVAAQSGLIEAGRPLLVMLSGGPDSTCLLDVAARLGAVVSALHVDYGLRGAESRADARHCAELCERLGVPLVIEHVALGQSGNLQARAREARYALAERHASGDYAAAHTLSDQAETVVYRLATSPGRRALLGMSPRRGRLVRPLLGVTRAEALAHCRAHRLAWREDASNADPRFARARVREDVMPVLDALRPGAQRTIAETAALLRDEAEVLDAAVSALMDRVGRTAAARSELEREPPALARLVLRRMAEEAAGAQRSLSRADADAVLALARAGGSASIDLGGGLRAVAEYGTLRFTLTDEVAAAPEPVELTVPGTARFGPWEVEARIGAGGEEMLGAEALGSSVTVRAWRDGDRMRPAGLGGSKSLQDLFTDRKVPRALRRSLPVVEAAGEIAWVAGVAVGERFAPRERAELVVSLSARRAAVQGGPAPGLD